MYSVCTLNDQHNFGVLLYTKMAGSVLASCQRFVLDIVISGQTCMQGIVEHSSTEVRMSDAQSRQPRFESCCFEACAILFNYIASVHSPV